MTSSSLQKSYIAMLYNPNSVNLIFKRINFIIKKKLAVQFVIRLFAIYI
jgi:hypothetical protein